MRDIKVSKYSQRRSREDSYVMWASFTVLVLSTASPSDHMQTAKQQQQNLSGKWDSPNRTFQLKPMTRICTASGNSSSKSMWRKYSHLLRTTTINSPLMRCNITKPLNSLVACTYSEWRLNQSGEIHRQTKCRMCWLWMSQVKIPSRYLKGQESDRAADTSNPLEITRNRNSIV